MLPTDASLVGLGGGGGGGTSMAVAAASGVFGGSLLVSYACVVRSTVVRLMFACSLQLGGPGSRVVLGSGVHLDRVGLGRSRDLRRLPCWSGRLGCRLGRWLISGPAPFLRAGQIRAHPVCGPPQWGHRLVVALQSSVV